MSKEEDDKTINQEQIEKNRRKRQRQKERKANNKQNLNLKDRDFRTLSREEKKELKEIKAIAAKERKQEKIAKENSVVVLADSSEAKSLAYKVDSINMITENVRANMGSQYVSFADGQELLEMFNNIVVQGIDEFISLAASKGIGGYRDINSYKDQQKKLKNKVAKTEETLKKYIDNENADESKERKKRDKEIENLSKKMIEAQETLSNATLAYDELVIENENKLLETEEYFRETVQKQITRIKEEDTKNDNSVETTEK